MKKMPNTNNWLPRKDASKTLKDIFYKRCLHVESLILARAKQEQELNIDNFDSGLGLEEIIREEMVKLLPERYFVTKGIINDQNGSTSGDHDLIIFNKTWFPFLKYGATSESRKFHFPMEGVYAVGEIKQTLTFDSLDKAMEKLVICERLKRPKTSGNRIVENRELGDFGLNHTNPLYKFIIATNLSEQVTVDEIFRRFFEINKKLKRSEIINCLCIFQKATILWSYLNKKNKKLEPAMFCNNYRDLSAPIFPVLIEVNKDRKSVFSELVINLSTHLFNTILGAEDLAVAYGNKYHGIKIPPLNKFSIDPK